MSFYSNKYLAPITVVNSKLEVNLQTKDGGGGAVGDGTRSLCAGLQNYFIFSEKIKFLANCKIQQYSNISKCFFEICT